MKKVLAVIALISASQLLAITVKNNTGKDIIARGNFEDNISEITIYAQGKEPFQHLPNASRMEIGYKNAYASSKTQVNDIKENDLITINETVDKNGKSCLIIQKKDISRN